MHLKWGVLLGFVSNSHFSNRCIFFWRRTKRLPVSAKGTGGRWFINFAKFNFGQFTRRMKCYALFKSMTIMNVAMRSMPFFCSVDRFVFARAPMCCHHQCIVIMLERKSKKSKTLSLQGSWGPAPIWESKLLQPFGWSSNCNNFYFVHE